MKAMLMVLADCDLCMGRNISEMGSLLVDGSIHMKRGARTVKCVHIILSQLIHISPVSTHIQSLWNRQTDVFGDKYSGSVIVRQVTVLHQPGNYISGNPRTDHCI